MKEMIILFSYRVLKNFYFYIMLFTIILDKTLFCSFLANIIKTIIYTVNSSVYEFKPNYFVLMFCAWNMLMPTKFVVNSYNRTSYITKIIVISYILLRIELNNNLSYFIVISYFMESYVVNSYISKPNVVNSYISHVHNSMFSQMEKERADNCGTVRPRGTPPPPPSSLGSRLYPRGSEPFNSTEPHETQLAKISRDRQLNEQNSFIDMKGEEYREFRRRHQSHRYCETCSEACTSTRNYMMPVFHRHGSSKMYRAQAPTDDCRAYLCLFCKVSPHRVKISIRTPVLISSSSLHDWQGRRYENQYVGDEIHMDTLTIPGGTINSLQHALQAEYGTTYRPLDILCVFGINDLVRGRPVPDIVKDMQEFQRAVHALAPQDEKNSVAIATIFLPPKMTDFGEGWVGNRKDDIIELNHHILRLNQEQHLELLPTGFAPRYHTWGLKSRKSRRRNEPRTSWTQIQPVEGKGNLRHAAS